MTHQRSGLTTPHYVLRDFRYFRRPLVAVVCAGALGSGVIGASLMTGTALKASLRRQAEASLGRVACVASAGGRSFPAAVTNAFEGSVGVLSVPGFGLLDGAARAVRIHGVDEAFFSLNAGQKTRAPVPATGEMYVNVAAARAFRLKEGEALTVRLTAQEGTAELLTTNPDPVTVHGVVARILTQEEFGDFNPSEAQSPVPTVFMNRRELSERLGMEGEAVNLLLWEDDTQVGRPALRLEDSGLRMEEGYLKSDDYFLPEGVVRHLCDQGVVAEMAMAYFVGGAELRQNSELRTQNSEPGTQNTEWETEAHYV
ncbi:MAG: hypothetical protein FWF84_02655, partial [Kiritimatiellaeota bacterium]|nr:hypothetical protein [Kiritimatiellota bacterium]